MRPRLARYLFIAAVIVSVLGWFSMADASMNTYFRTARH